MDVRRRFLKAEPSHRGEEKLLTLKFWEHAVGQRILFKKVPLAQEIRRISVAAPL